MNYAVMVIDWSNLVYRAGHAGQTVLKDPNTGVVTNTFHYTLTMLAKLLARFQPQKLVIAMDNPYFNYARKTLWPEYKGLRKTVQSDDHRRIGADLKELCGLLKHWPTVNMFWDDLEADDVIAWVCRKAYQGQTKLVVSSDKDMMQLIAEDVHVFYPGKVERLITPQSWVEHMQKLLKLDPELVPRMDQYVEFKCIIGETGPTSDNVPGIKAFGPKTTAKFLKKYGTWAQAQVDISNALNGGYKLSATDKRVLEKEWRDVFDRNKILMDLNQYIQGNTSGLRIFNGLYDPMILRNQLNKWSLAKVATGKLGSCFSRLAEIAKVSTQPCR